MASYLQVENISKSYGPKILFDNICFNINEGDKMALIGPNGCGKSSLLKILAGKDKSDSGGKITFLKDIRISFLEQEYEYDPDNSIMDEVMGKAAGKGLWHNEEQKWEYERAIVRNLTMFRLGDVTKKMKDLSGGEIKRTAIAALLAENPDFLILDEPTNHLDIEAIETLENYLSRSRATLLMVTHDRYFLDKVCNTILELDGGSLYLYRGDYGQYLEKREERTANFKAETDKVRNILRRELEWMRSTPQARTGKARYRINAFYDLKERASETIQDRRLDMEGLESSRLGTKIFNCKDVSFKYGEKTIIDGFTYNFYRYEKVGIVGANGIGKSTFLNLLTGRLSPTSGTIERGESVRIGYYSQAGMRDAAHFDPEATVLETVGDTAMLNRFLFPHNMFNSRLRTLSGGELRRLYLLTILLKSPNILILDEPTNDLDIVTLNVLEEYLKDFKGTLIIVSHDRHFLDRLVDHLFVFCGDGVIKDFIGSYSEYRAFIKEYEAQQKAGARAEEKAAKAARTAAQAASQKPAPAKKKLSYKEQRELEQLEKDLGTLGEERARLEADLNSGTLPYEELQKASVRIGEILQETETKENRWLELSCML